MKRTSILLLLLIILQLNCYAAKFSFAVFGDNRDGDKVFMDLIDRMNKDKSIKFAVNTGDLTSRGIEAEYEKYLDMSGSSMVEIHNAIGNHDIGFMGMGKGIFKNKFGADYYYFDHDDSRFIVMDNASGKGLGRKQWNWLKNALDTDKKIFVFMHKPIFDVSGSYPRYVMESRSESEALDMQLKMSKVKYVFAGHIHGYGRQKIDGIVYINTAGAGAPLYLPAFSGGFYHYVKVTVDGPKIKDEVVKIYD